MDANMTMNVSTYIYIGQQMNTRIAVLLSIFSTVVSVGMVGNLWVARIVGTVLIHDRSESVPQSVLLLIFGLCLSDILILLSLSLMVFDMLLGQWVFGHYLCLWFVSTDMINKFFAPFLLAILSATCFISICHPNTTRFVRSFSFGATAVATSFLIALTLSAPAFFYTNVAEYQRKAINGVVPLIRKCRFEPTPTVVWLFTSYGTLLGYLLPMLCFCYSYAKVALFVRRHTQSVVVLHTIPIWRMGRLILALVSVYISCWTPFWVGTWLSFVVTMNKIQITIIYLTHVLPYVSCTVYPIIYTWMNRGIQEAHSRISSEKRRKNGLSGTAIDTSLLHSEISMNRLSRGTSPTPLKKVSAPAAAMRTGGRPVRQLKKPNKRQTSYSISELSSQAPLIAKNSQGSSTSNSSRKRSRGRPLDTKYRLRTETCVAKL